jgi:hypothetical protein
MHTLYWDVQIFQMLFCEFTYLVNVHDYFSKANKPRRYAQS